MSRALHKQHLAYFIHISYHHVTGPLLNIAKKCLASFLASCTILSQVSFMSCVHLIAGQLLLLHHCYVQATLTLSIYGLLWVLVDPCPSITFCPSHPDTEHLWAYSKCWLTPAPPSLFCSSHPDTEHLWVYSDCWSTPASMFCPSHSDTEHGASKGLHGVLRGRLL